MKQLREKDIIVIKSDGSQESWDPNKIYKFVKYACEGTSLQPSELLVDFNIQLQKRMKSSHIQNALIKMVADKISDDNPDIEIVAARLLNQKIRKDVYGKYLPAPFVDVVKERVKKKYYDKNILTFFTEEELQELSSYINYDRDDKFRYIGLLQLHKKYLMRKKNTDINIETPQEIFMLIGAYIFGSDTFLSSKRKMLFTKRMYNSLSKFEILLSTPISVGVRTPLRMYSSCAGIAVSDTEEGIAQSFKDIYKLTLNRAGIGATYGHIRGIGADIDNGREKHTGITPILKVAENISLSALQPGSGRGGSITQYYPFFHWEIENIVELKNNKGTDDNRVRKSDHAICFNKLFFERYANNEDITLFYMNDVSDLFEKMGDYEYFKREYENLENRRGINKKRINARKLYDKFWQERSSTGRLYKVNSDDFQTHSAFKIPIYFSNLCTEINLPAHKYFDFKIVIKKGYKDAMSSLFDDMIEAGEWYSLYEYFWFNKPLPDTDNFKTFKSFLAKPKDISNNKIETYIFNFYEIFVCILGGINLSVMNSYKHIEDTARILVRFLDTLIDYQDYPISAMEKGAKGRRALGISISGLFHYLAKKNYAYNSLEARNEVHKIMEALYYGAITESIELAKEKGICKYYKDTKYSDGLMVIDTYNKNVDELVDVDYQYDWENVRNDLLKYGMRNSTLLTIVPASNSARIANTISGIELPQSLTMYIEDKRISGKYCLPDVAKYKDYYVSHNAWKIDTSNYFKLIAVIQKWCDQGISINQYNSYLKYDNEKIPYSVLLEQDHTALKYGLKTMYYFKTESDDEGKKHSGNLTEINCAGGACTL